MNSPISFVCEVLQGVRDDASAKNVERQLLKLEVLATGGVGLAGEAARNYRTYGVAAIVAKNDRCLIATFRIREGHLLLHRDRDFDPFEDLSSSQSFIPELGHAIP